MSEVEVPDELPCEKCGKMTAYDGLVGSLPPCEHCGAQTPHTMTGSTGCWGMPFLVFFVGAFLMVLIDPFGMGEGAIIILFPIFFLMFLALFSLFIFVGLKVKREERKKAAKEKSLGG